MKAKQSALSIAASETPLYVAVKQSIMAQIRSGKWPPHYRVPSENELVAQLGVSRMTVNRAVRELATEGLLVRIQGLGTFVAEEMGRSDIVEVRNIADEIRARGHDYRAKVACLEAVEASAEIACELTIEPGAAVFHSIIIHFENRIPVQLEDRYVNCDLAPNYLDQDFTQTTPNRFLSDLVAWAKAEYEIEAAIAENWEARLLAIARTDPCLRLRRRTFAPDGRVVTSVRALMPGGRYKLQGQRSAS